MSNRKKNKIQKFFHLQPLKSACSKALLLLGLYLLVHQSKCDTTETLKSRANFNNLLNTNALTSAYSSLVYAFSSDDFKTITFNSTDFAIKAYAGNFLFLLSGIQSKAYLLLSISSYITTYLQLFLKYISLLPIYTSTILLLLL